MTYEETGQDIGKQTDDKNKHYGNSFAKCELFLKILYPDGINPDQYPDVLTVARVFDKLMRIATSKNAYGENPWRDIAGYAILMSRVENEKD